VIFDTTATSYSVNNRYLVFANCDTAEFLDTSWNNIQLIDLLRANVAVAASCTDIPNITITGSGSGFGEGLDSDSNDKVSWTNGTASTCLWSGSVDTNWKNPNNWSNCANGRDTYPDHNDWAVIPTGTANQPVITEFTAIQGFGVGVGGGTVTINSSVELRLYSSGYDEFQSDVKFSGESESCTNCLVKFEDEGGGIINNATVTLLDGIGLYLEYRGSKFKVGYGTSGGHLATGPADADPNHWPRITGSQTDGIQVQGFSGSPSSINVDGLSVTNVRSYGRKHFTFSDYYSIAKFDNLNMDSTSSGIDATIWYVDLINCDNATFPDISWAGWQLVDAPDETRGNIDASDATCSDIDAITVFANGLGSGAAFELDPADVIDWQNW
jgi:hypothetical protein